MLNTNLKYITPILAGSNSPLGVGGIPNIDDERESSALEIIDTVIQKGGIVSYNNPHIPTVKTNAGNTLNSVDLSANALAGLLDVIVIK